MGTLSADDRQALIDLSYAYAAGIDHRDWLLYRSVFAPSVAVDFSSWSGRIPEVMDADDWTEAVRSVNGGFDATQHLMSNHRFLDMTTDAEVVGVNEMQAQHFLGASTLRRLGRAGEDAWCLLGGHYTNVYHRAEAGWQIASCQLTVRWRTGDEGIFALARRRHD